MKILLTGATGYIAKRLLPRLLAEGHEVVCCVRDLKRFDISRYPHSRISAIEVDFLKPSTLGEILPGFDAAYYLIHSMSTTTGPFEEMEKRSAENFRDQLSQIGVKQVIYLGGIVNNEELSRHLNSRKNVEEILGQGSYHLTTLKAAIIVGSGSASFEIIRDLVEKLPVMVAPKWLNTKCQPIAIQNVVQMLQGVLGQEETFDRSFDIGGPEILTYKEMLLQFAEVRKLKRFIGVVPVMTPKLSSYWLYFITSTSYKLAVNLVDSMKVEVICRGPELHKLLDIDLISYRKAVRMAFGKIEQQEVVSSWTDASSGNVLGAGISALVNIPVYGCLRDYKKTEITDTAGVLERIWAIGGRNGWYYGNWLWGMRGFVDKLVGGVGLRRGRRSNSDLSAGDALDFWRVLLADKQGMRLLLYAEMKLPGEAWLEFEIRGNVLYQTATFRPWGLWGRAYWYALLPFHLFIFRGMIRRIATGK